MTATSPAYRPELEPSGGSTVLDRPFLRRLARAALTTAVHGTVTAVVSVPFTLAIWWITQR